MITSEQCSEIKSRIQAREQMIDERFPSCRKKNGWTVIPKEVGEQLPEVTNDERSSLEVFDFVTNPPERYFAYVKPEKDDFSSSGIITTWTGEFLGSYRVINRYRLFNTSRVQAIRVKAKNGFTYSGTYYQDAGQYCRLRKVKG